MFFIALLAFLVVIPTKLWGANVMVTATPTCLISIEMWSHAIPSSRKRLIINSRDASLTTFDPNIAPSVVVHIISFRRKESGIDKVAVEEVSAKGVRVEGDAGKGRRRRGFTELRSEPVPARLVATSESTTPVRVLATKTLSTTLILPMAIEYIIIRQKSC